MAGIKDEALIKLSSEVAKQFIESYYAALDGNRGAIPGFYHPNASIVWNGNPLKGGDAFGQFFTAMPASNYDVQSYDAHPLGKNPTKMMLSISGSVKYGDTRDPRGFSDTVILVGDSVQSSKFKIESQGFRLVSA